jgi:hypothetical protein
LRSKLGVVHTADDIESVSTSRTMGFLFDAYASCIIGKRGSVTRFGTRTGF